MATRKFRTPPQSLRGMRDILPQDQIYWEKVRQAFKKNAADFGFDRIDTPILEPLVLFDRTIGQGTDIVEKEMYSFITRGKEHVALRPEFTASIARSYIENGMNRLTKPVKLCSMGPLFRYERPQQGRYRQHHQVDFEAFGRADPLMDAQIILVAQQLLKKIGIHKRTRVLINSIGCLECRKPYLKSLGNFLKKEKVSLCPDCKKRSQKNPLRTLDCKVENCKKALKKAPKLVDALCEKCSGHFKQVLGYLDELGLKYDIDTSLVRGLDYYNRTVFEIVARDLKGNNKYALVGGGRYDGLIKLLGGKDTSGIGFGSGVERFITELKQNAKEKKIQISAGQPKPVHLVAFGEMGKKRSIKLLVDLLNASIKTTESFGRDSIKAQLKAADRSGAKFALIIGQKEALDQTVIVRNMEVGSQEIVPLEKLIKHLKKMLKKKN
ncbi:MAG: histidine--tRNA ligase [Candidatus Moranbacteria bacterium]|nr:histidine--tRNA ligase [Candidatus Moranbacteria bacterium]